MKIIHIFKSSRCKNLQLMENILLVCKYINVGSYVFYLPNNKVKLAELGKSGKTR